PVAHVGSRAEPDDLLVAGLDRKRPGEFRRPRPQGDRGHGQSGGDQHYQKRRTQQPSHNRLAREGSVANSPSPLYTGPKATGRQGDRVKKKAHGALAVGLATAGEWVFVTLSPAYLVCSRRNPFMHILALDVGTSSVKAAILDVAAAAPVGPVARVSYELD